MSSRRETLRKNIRNFCVVFIQEQKVALKAHQDWLVLEAKQRAEKRERGENEALDAAEVELMLAENSISMDAFQEQRRVLREQHEEAVRRRRFDDARSIKQNLQELEAEQKRLHDTISESVLKQAVVSP